MSDESVRLRLAAMGPEEIAAWLDRLLSGREAAPALAIGPDETAATAVVRMGRAAAARDFRGRFGAGAARLLNDFVPTAIVQGSGRREQLIDLLFIVESLALEAASGYLEFVIRKEIFRDDTELWSAALRAGAVAQTHGGRTSLWTEAWKAAADGGSATVAAFDGLLRCDFAAAIDHLGALTARIPDDDPRGALLATLIERALERTSRTWDDVWARVQSPAVASLQRWMAAASIPSPTTGAMVRHGSANPALAFSEAA